MNNILYKIGCTGIYVYMLVHLTMLAEAKVLINSSDSLTFDIDYMQSTGNDTLTLEVGHEYFGGIFLTNPDVYYATKDSKGLFHFKVPVKYEEGYFTLTAKKTFSYNGSMTDYMHLITPQFWERGDSVRININHWERPGGIYSLCRFSGHGCEKYKARYAIHTLKATHESFIGTRSERSTDIYLPEMQKGLLSALEKFKKVLNKKSYGALKADINFSGKGYFYPVKEKYKKLLKESKFDSMVLLQSEIEKGLEDESLNELNFSGVEFSQEYLYYAYEKARCLAFFQDTTGTPEVVFREIGSRYNGTIRDALLLYFFKTERLPENAGNLFKRAEGFAANTKTKRALKEFETILPGRIFGDYTFTDIYNRKMQLSDFDNKVVFLDFYFTGCGACQTYYRDIISKVEERFRQTPEVVFISISMDLAFSKWKKTVQSGEYTSLEAVNVYTSGLGFKHAVIVENNIYAYPTAILLGRGRKLSAFNSKGLYNYKTLVKHINSLL